MPENIREEKIKALSGQLAIEMDVGHFTGGHFTDMFGHYWENCKPVTNGKVCKTAPASEISKAIIYCIENKVNYKPEMKARKNGRVSLKQGTIYPVLRILQKEGLLESEIRASESGPARKYYWITAKGKGTLEIWTESWHNTRDFVENILGGEPDE